MTSPIAKEVAVIVAHPDDETLWAGGTLLGHPEWTVYIVGLCRGKDEERSGRFFTALKQYKANGRLGDLNDGPEQNPIADEEVDDHILTLLPVKHYDLIITHSIAGEYTRHRRHEEIGRAVVRLWLNGKISTRELWAFAYDDENKAHYPLAESQAPVQIKLSSTIWRRKYDIINSIYGFTPNSFEAKTTPVTEAFWKFTNPHEVQHWVESNPQSQELL